MDLKYLLNPLPEPQDHQQISSGRNTNPSQNIPPHPNLQPQPQPNNNLQSRFLFSPRRLDPETASVSTTSSTKRRRTNRGNRIDVDARPPRTTSSAPMSRTFSEIQVPSDTSSLSDEQAVKRAVAQLSLDDDMRLKPGTRVEALKAGTQGTWYVARIVEYATFPALYIDGPESEEPRNQEYPMVCVHYEGFSPLQSAWIPQTSLRLMSNEEDMSPSEWNNYKKLWRYGPRGLEEHWSEYTHFAINHGSVSNTGVVWAGENHGCPCRFHNKSSAETKRETVGVGRHPERPDRLQKIMESWQKNTLLRHVRRVPSREITKTELALAHTGEHIRNYFAPPSWHQATSKEIVRLPTPPPSSTGSATTTTVAESLQTTPPPLTEVEEESTSPDEVKQVTFADSPIKVEFEQDFPPLESPTKSTFSNTNPGSPHKRRASGLDMDLMSALASKKDEIELKPAVWPETLTHMMGCGELAIGMIMTGHSNIAVDTTFDPDRSPEGARLATGSLLNLCDAVITGRVKNGFALIRPPGHHAEPDAAMGFCIYNNVGVAAKWALQRYPCQVQRILIIDWDVHHGNGTERIFYEDPNVLYISIHRYDDGTFYPFTGSPYNIGAGKGVGKNVNITWDKHRDRPNDRIGDPEYLAAFHYLIMPIAREFNPDLVFISAGFDAAEGHSNGLGGLRVTPTGYSMMTHLATQLAHGRVIMALEGGYELAPLANCATACLDQLLSASKPGGRAMEGGLRSLKPCQTAQEDLARVWGVQRDHWRCLGENPAERGWSLPREWKRKANGSDSLGGTPTAERRKRRLTLEGY